MEISFTYAFYHNPSLMCLNHCALVIIKKANYFKDEFMNEAVFSKSAFFVSSVFFADVTEIESVWRSDSKN